jgi:UDP-N-acetylglucosamine pyrophosphorylase
MNKKQIYCFNTTIKENNLLNYYRCYSDVLDNEQRTNNIYNNIRDINITDVHQQTENFDKYFNTRYIDFVRMTKQNFLYDDGEDEEDDEYDF